MPFTPFHLGVGAVCKAALDKKFSLLVFAGAQVVMDIEPLIGLIQNKPILHGITHTVVGALGLGVLAWILGKPISNAVLKFFDMAQSPHEYITWQAAGMGAFVGTYSHIVLDAIMHHDMNPLYPFWLGNPLLECLPLTTLHGLCVGLGILGGVGMAVRFWWRGK